MLCGHVETARGRPMTTEAHEVTTTDELRHLFVGGVGGGRVSVLCGHVETARGRPMTTEAHEVTTTDELRHLFVGGVGGGHVSPRCFVDTWKLRRDA